MSGDLGDLELSSVTDPSSGCTQVSSRETIFPLSQLESILCGAGTYINKVDCKMFQAKL